VEPAGWVISARLAHPAIVSEADYIAAQDASAPTQARFYTQCFRWITVVERLGHRRPGTEHAAGRANWNGPRSGALVVAPLAPDLRDSLGRLRARSTNVR